MANWASMAGASLAARRPRALTSWRLKAFALTNFNVEAQCTPSRSAIDDRPLFDTLGHTFDTDRRRTRRLDAMGTHVARTSRRCRLCDGALRQVAFGEHSRASAQRSARFDEWYGIPRTTDEAFWPSEPAATAAGASFMHIIERRKGEKSRELALYDLEERRLIEAESTGRAIAFIKRSAQARKPFYACIGPILCAFPDACRYPKFVGKTGFRDFRASLARHGRPCWREPQFRASLRSRIRDDAIRCVHQRQRSRSDLALATIVRPLARLHSSAWRSSTSSAIACSPESMSRQARVRIELVREVDSFTTLAMIAGADGARNDRPIDGSPSAFPARQIGADQTGGLPGIRRRPHRSGELAASRKFAFYDEHRDCGRRRSSSAAGSLRAHH